MHFQNSDPSLEIRPVHDDPPVKAARAQQRLVKDLRTVRGADDKDSLGRLKSVHLGEELVQRLLSLFISSAVPGVAAPADRVDLVDKNNARRVLVGFLEQVAHARCAHADIELDEIRARKGEERHMGLSGDSLGQQCFAGAGRADEKSSFGELSADLHVFARIVQEVDDFHQGLLGLVFARDIRERDAGILLHILFGSALTDTAHEASASCPSENKAHDHPQKDDRQHIGEQERDDHS